MKDDHDVETIAISWSWDVDEKDELAVFPLRNFISVEQEDLPGIYLMSPVTSEPLKFPDEDLTLARASPELVLAWARIVGLDSIVVFYSEMAQQLEEE